MACRFRENHGVDRLVKFTLNGGRVLWLILRQKLFLNVILLKFEFLFDFGCEKLQNRRPNLVNYSLILEKLHIFVELGEALHDGARHYHHFNHVDLCLVAQIEKYEHQIKFVLDQLCVVHQIFLIWLSKFGQKNHHREYLKDIHHLLSLRVLHLKLLIESFSFFLRVQPEDCLREL